MPFRVSATSLNDSMLKIGDQSQPRELLTKLSFADVQQWLEVVKTNIIRSGQFTEVAETLNGIGPAELHGVGGEEEGLAYGRGRHSTVKTTVSNRQMGEFRIGAFLATYPDKTRDDAVKALTATQTTAKNIQSLRNSGRGLMALLCSSIQEELLLKLMEDSDFEKARRGTCVVWRSHPD